MTHTTTRATLSEHYKAVRARLNPRPLPQLITQIEPTPEPKPKPEPTPTPELRPQIKRRPAPALAPVTIPSLTPTARRYVHILYDVAARHDVTLEDLVGHSRSHKFIVARHEACYLLREANYSYPQIGRFLGNRNHTTIVHGVQKHKEKLEGIK